MDKKKKALTIVVVILLLIVIFLTYLLLQKYILKKDFEKSVLPFASQNENTIFEINKIVLFSNCDAQNKTSSATNFTLENLYQYTDIAFFVSSPYNEVKTLENTLKKLSINNISYLTKPNLGQPKLYYKSLNQFATSSFSQENEITTDLEFNITSEDEANLDTPILYNNLANPITLCYVNDNIKTDYTITDTLTPITYDGSLLKKCNIQLEDIYCKLSFDIYITNNLDENFKTTVFVNIPLNNGETSLYDGKINLTQNVNYKFYKY